MPVSLLSLSFVLLVEGAAQEVEEMPPGEKEVVIYGRGFDQMRTWENVDPELRWRYQTFSALLENLGDLESLLADVETRIAVASTIEERTVS